jgi:hypothetical protein
MSLVTATLDGDVLALLAAGEIKLTGRDISRRIGASQEGTRVALERLLNQGILLRENAGNAHLYLLNRKHLAAPLIEQIALLRLTLINRLRELLGEWSIPPLAATLFGSVARNQSNEKSDIDVMVVRPSSVDADSPVWREQLEVFQSRVASMTGNDCRVFEVPDPSTRLLRGVDGLVKEVAEEGIDLFGSLHAILLKHKERAKKR